jgi:SAM-dependent methyltransferase
MDFKKFYEEQKDYSAFRNNQEKRTEYEVKVRWKADRLVRLIPADLAVTNILEIGCAIGILLNNIAERLSVRDISGIDISAENIKVAKELFPDSIFYEGTIEDLKSVMETRGLHIFDLVILSDIIEHIPDDLKFLETVRDISSHVVVNLPLEKCFRNRHRNYGENDPSGHLRYYDRDMAVSLMRKAGFNVISSFTANALMDKDIFKIYLKDKKERLRLKPFAKRLFWTVFYFAEDRIMMISKGLFEKLYGTNYFALLRRQ